MNSQWWKNWWWLTLWVAISGAVAYASMTQLIMLGPVRSTAATIPSFVAAWFLGRRYAWAPTVAALAVISQISSHAMNGWVPSLSFALNCTISLTLVTSLGWLSDASKELREEIKRRAEAQQELHDLNTTLEERIRVASEDLNRANEALLFHNQSLEEVVSQRTADLTATVEELDWLLATISHDIRSPLRNISMYASRLSGTAGPRLEPDEVRSLDRIQHRVRELTSLLEALVMVSRSRFEAPELRDVSVADVLGPVLEQAREGTDRPILVVEPLAVVRGNALLLREVLQNAIDNAVQHGAGSIEIRTEVVGTQVGIAITDEGVSKLTDPHAFESAGEFTPGLGLRIATKLSERMGGEFRLQRLPSGHTEASIVLPLGKFAEPIQAEPQRV